MDAEAIQHKLSMTRDKLLSAIEALSDEALYEAGAYGDWSVADVLANVAAWESELVTGLSEVQRGKKPARLLAALKDVEKYDRTRFTEYKDRTLDLIFDDLQGSRIQLDIRLEDLTKRDLTDPRRYRWGKNKPLWQLIAASSFERERQFIPSIERFARQQAATRPAEEAE